jgi:hypothetical protein
MRKIFVVIILFILSFSSSFSQEKDFKDVVYKNCELNLEYQKNLDLQNKIVYNGNRFLAKDSLGKIQQEAKEKLNNKSVFLGGVLSGLIPGAGQFYAKTYIKSAAFLLAEAGLWVAYAIFQKKGNDQTDSYQNYANQNWDMRRYAVWLNTNYTAGVDITKSDDVVRAQINTCEEKYFSHTLPPFGEQQYYEVIGKYKNFTAGWSQAPSDITKDNWSTYPEIPQVDQYMTDRQQANNYYDKGSTMLTVVIINHLLSAADGAWSVMRYNDRINVKANVDVKSKYSFYQQKSVIIPHLNVCVNF